MKPRLENSRSGDDGVRLHEQSLRQSRTGPREIERSEALAVGEMGVAVWPIAAGDDAHDGIGPVRTAIHLLARGGVVSEEVSKSCAKHGPTRAGDPQTGTPILRMSSVRGTST
jgi:hypothetical protein